MPRTTGILIGGLDDPEEAQRAELFTDYHGQRMLTSLGIQTVDEVFCNFNVLMNSDLTWNEFNGFLMAMGVERLNEEWRDVAQQRGLPNQPLTPSDKDG